MTAPRIVKFGGGVDSTGLLCGLIERDIRPDAVIFADTGGERDHTYANVAAMDILLRRLGWPGVTAVWYTTAAGERETLEGHSLRTRRMPSKSYGRPSCSVRFKHEPTEKWLKGWPPAVTAWANGERVQMAIGYNIDELRRWMSAPKQDNRFDYVYPLVEWKWGRDECLQAAARFGLRPQKSACWFCGSAREAEVMALREEAPDLFARGLAMEDGARPFSGSIEGLGQNFSWRALDDALTRQQRINFAPSVGFVCACHEGADDEEAA